MYLVSYDKDGKPLVFSLESRITGYWYITPRIRPIPVNRFTLSITWALGGFIPSSDIRSITKEQLRLIYQEERVVLCT